MVKPPLLKKGDRVAIVAPARKISAEQIDSSIRILDQYGFQVIPSLHLHENAHSYLAATDDQRLDDIQRSFDDDSIRAVICARGGYGSTRIIDGIDLRGFAKAPKWLVGFSDITAIHLKLFKAEIMSIHGTMPVLFSKQGSAVSVESLMNVLTKGSFSLAAQAHTFNRYGKSQGRLVGGNLSLIVNSLGTRAEVETENCILVLEEIDEYFYRVDRMMTQLKRAGKLKNLNGIVIGHMTDIKESDLPFGESIGQIILDKVKEYQYPVAFGFPTGHENPNLAWIHGHPVTLTVAASGSEVSTSVIA